MPAETLHYENARFAQSLFANDPRHLKSLDAQLGVKATARDGWIRLEGEAEPVERAKDLFQQLEAMLKAGTAISHRDFTSALDVVKTEGVAALQSLHTERIHTSQRKAHVLPKTTGQKKYVEAIRTHDVTLGVGPAGTGKTYLAVAAAVAALEKDKVRRLCLVRPAVEAGERLGFLPGSLQEKIDPYLRPLYDALFDMLDAEKVERMVERNAIEVAPLAFMRGRTLNDAFIIMDEAQNTTPEQMKMLLTRQGFNSKTVVTGDPTQVDLAHHQRSGLTDALEIVAGLEGVAHVQFNDRDVVRHNLVQRIVKAYEANAASRQLPLKLSDTPAA